MRSSCRAAALQHAVRNHTIGMGTLVSLAVAVSAMFYVGGFCIARCRALLVKQKLGGSCMRSCARAAAFQHAARNHTIGMGTLGSLAVAVSVMFYVGGFCIARCRALLDKQNWGSLAGFAVAVSLLFCVGVFCAKCCRILSDRPHVHTNATCVRIVKQIHTCTYLWFATCVVVCVRARVYFLVPARDQVTILGITCRFCGGGFILVLRRRFLR